MNIRTFLETQEIQLLSPYAAKSINSKGRKISIPPCELRTEFQRDRDRILHCKAFRRLMHKTQVFISPEGDHYRTRLTHTLEVMQIARTIARALRLNEDLTEAIALGHDLGHTPFGHTGEEALNNILPEGFHHNEQSIRVVEQLEKNGMGLNLTWEVLDGIVHHRTSGKPETLEGKVVQLADKVAYINHDIDDAIRAKVLEASALPDVLLTILGQTSSQRIDFLIRDIVLHSMDKNEIQMGTEAKRALYELRAFMFKTVYLSQLQINEKYKIQHILSEIYYFYKDHQNKLPKEFVAMIENGEKQERVICDYIAGMTDRYAVKLFKTLFLPSVTN